MSGKKLVYLTPLHFSDSSCLGGAERYTVNLARGVVAASAGRCRVEIISFDKTARRETLQPGVTLRLLPIANPEESMLRVLSWDLADALAGADLVHLHQVAMRASEMCLFLAKLQRIPVCATDHGSTTSAEGMYADRLELADQVICYSDYGASLMKTRTPLAVVKGGVDGEYFSPPAEPPVRDGVLFVGRLVPSKGVDRLISALPPELPLTVCGRPYNSTYLELLKRLAKGKRVRFLFQATDVEIRNLYRQAWVTVLPSSYEDYYGNLCPAPELMGLTILESMGCGTPVLCPRAGAMPEFVRHGETGFVYDTLDELTDRLRYLGNNPAAVERMGRLARRSVEEQYDHKVVGARMLAVYQRWLGAMKEAA